MKLVTTQIRFLSPTLILLGALACGGNAAAVDEAPKAPKVAQAPSSLPSETVGELPKAPKTEQPLSSKQSEATDAEPKVPKAKESSSSMQSDLAELGKRLRSNFNDEEMDLLIDFMTESALSALKGGEVTPLPPELEFKLEILRERVIKEGNAAWQSMMLEMHKKLDETIQSIQPPPPKIQPPYIPPPLPPLPSFTPPPGRT